MERQERETVPFKALAIRQPWAALIADGTKAIEYRTWTTAYRGPLVIIASGTRAAESGDYRTLDQPTSCLMAIVDLVDIQGDDGEFSWILANPRRLVQTRYTRSRLRPFNLEPDVVVKLADPAGEIRSTWTDAERAALSNTRRAGGTARKRPPPRAPAKTHALAVAWLVLDAKASTRAARARTEIRIEVPAAHVMVAGQPVFIVQRDRTLSTVMDVKSVTRGKRTALLTGTAAWTSDDERAGRKALEDARVDVVLPEKGSFPPIALTMPEARRLAGQIGHQLPKQ